MPAPHSPDSHDSSTNLAARAGRWSAQHRKKAIFGWLAFVILAFAIGSQVGTKTLEDQESGVGESGRAEKAAFNAFPKKAEESVLVQSGKLKADDPKFKAAVADVVARLQRTKDVRAIDSPYSPGNQGNISPDGRSVLVDYELPGDLTKTQVSVEAPLATIAAVQKAHPGLRVEAFGDASTEKAVQEEEKKKHGQATPT